MPRMTIGSGLSTSEKYARYVNLSSVAGLEPITITRGSGAEVWDAAGNRYLDCFAGIAVVNSGHGHERVVAAATEQLRRLLHAGTYLYQIEVVADLAERLAEVAPGRLQKTFFCNSGAEAIEGALRLAKAATGRSEFVALDLGFHGRTNAALAVTGNRKRKQRGGPYTPGVAFAPAPYEYRCRMCAGTCSLACAEALEDVIDFRTAGEVAAFVAEPVLGEGGIIVPPDGYFRRVKEILDQRGILFIADEVQSGFGRTGRMFGIEHFGVEPDIMAMAKGIAAGLPLGAFIAREEVADSFQPGEHLSTFGGNPVSCAAAIANLEVLVEEQLPERSRALGEWLLAALQPLAGRWPQVGQVRGRGLMVGIELVEDRSTKRPAAALANKVRAAMRERGVLVGVGGFYGNVVRIQPPLVIDEHQLGLAVEVLDEALGAAGAG
jgi:4-aminobutyrate aminotransferase/(S)-3-amino-2-methylpropionate transaminase